MPDLRSKVIVALDVSDLQTAEMLVKELLPYTDYFKVGLELQTAVGGPQAVACVHGLGGKLFYDGKFDDIPNTVGRASAAISAQGVAMFNLHASAGRKSIEAAVANRGDSLVLGVTVLTSIGDEECVSIFGDTPGNKVLQFARMLVRAGAGGIICSPQELVFLGQHTELDHLVKVVPGSRPYWYSSDDQARVLSPGKTAAAGADYLVVGRPVTNPPKEIGGPADAIQLILAEIATALGGVGR